MTVQTGHNLKRIVIATIASILLVGALVAAALWSAHSHTRRLRLQIQRHIDSLRAAGLPVAMEDLARLYPDPPPSGDAAQLLRTTFPLIVRTGFANVPFVGGTDLPEGAVPMNAATREQAAAFIQANEPAFAALAKAWPAPARFACGFAQGPFNRPGPPLVNVRSLQQALAANAVCQAEFGNAEPAVQSLNHAFWFSRSLPPDSLVSYMIRRACEGLAVMALQRTLNRVALSEPQLAGLSRDLDYAATNSLEPVLITERCIAIWVFESVRNRSAPKGLIPSPDLTPLAILRRFVRLDPPIYRDTDYLQALKFLDQYQAAFRTPPSERLAQVGAIHDQVASQRWCLTASMVFPHWAKAATNDEKTAANLRMAHTALAVERYRLANAGKLPGVLGELVPRFLSSMPLDPFDDRPLRYKRTDHGYLIYSVGPDGVDNGGVARPPNDSSKPYDLPFAVER